MKKLILLYCFFAVLIASSSAQITQNQDFPIDNSINNLQISTLPHMTVQIGDNYGSGSNNMNYPVRRAEKNSYVRIIYPLNQNSVAGYIDTIWFYCTELGDSLAMDTSLTVYMRQAATLGSDYPFLNYLQKVFHTNEWRATTANQWNPIVLDTPYYYNGQDYLEIVFLHRNATTCSSGDIYFIKNTSNNDMRVQTCGSNNYELRYESRYSYPRFPIARFSIALFSCIDVSNPQVVYNGGDSVRLNWVERGQATQWQVRYVSDDGLQEGTLFVNDNPTCVINGLLGEYTYNFYVRPVCGNNDTGFYSSFTPVHIVTCPQPDSLIVSNVTDNSLLLSWRENGSAIQWKVYVSDVNGNLLNSYTVPTNYAQITGLDSWTHYIFNVRSYCGQNDSSLMSFPLTTRTFIDSYGSAEFQVGSFEGTYNHNTPFDNNWRHSWTQMIYPTDTIAIDGYIDTIWWYAATVSSPVYDTSVTIYMGQTSEDRHSSNDDWLPLNQLFPVYHSSQVQPTDTGWFAIPLQVPFHYDGNGNLVICVSHQAQYYSSQWKYHYFSRENSVIRRRSDTDPNYANYPNLSPGTLSEQLPVMRFSISEQTPTLCGNPYNVRTIYNEFDSIAITWSSTGIPDRWQVSYGPNLDDPDNGASSIVTNNVFSIAIEDEASSYHFYVRTVCDTVLGDWIGPYVVVPATFVMGKQTRDTIYSCDKDIVINCFVARPQGSFAIPQSYFYDTLIIYPNSEGSVISVSGMIFHRDYISDARILNGAGIDGALLWELTNYSNNVEIPRITSTSGPLTLLVHYQYYIETDNVDSVFLLHAWCDESCIRPLLTDVSELTDRTAKIHWTCIETLPESFSVAYGPYDIFDVNDPASYDIVSGITNTYVILDSLLPSTHYSAAIKSECGDGSYSRWSYIDDFNTKCAAIPRSQLPYNADVQYWDYGENYVVPPQCWHSYGNLSHNQEADNEIALNNIFDTTTLIFPLFEDDIRILTVSFSARIIVEQNVYFPYNPPMAWKVGVMTDADDVTTFSSLYNTIYSLNDTNWNNYSISFDTYTGGGRYIAIRVPPILHVPTSSVNFKDISVTIDLPCMPPLSINVESVSQTQAVLSVNDTTQPDSRTFFYGTSPNVENAFDSILTDSDTCTLVDLLPNTRYYVWVHNNKVLEKNYSSPLTGPAIVETLPILYHTAQALSNNPAIGSVFISNLDEVKDSTDNYYIEGTHLLFSAYPNNETTVFVGWNDGDTTNPRTITLTQDTILTAFFESTEQITQFVDNQFVLMPNPTKNSVRISSTVLMLKIECYDLSGRVVYTSKPAAESCTLDTGNWRSGIYVIKITTETGAATRRLIIQ